jgi:spore germination protein
MSIKAGERLSGIQVSILIASSMIGIGLLTFPRRVAEAGEVAGITYVVVAGAVIVFFAVLSAWLSKVFPDKTVIEYSEILLGKFISKIITIFFMLYFLLISAVVLRNFADIIKVFLLKDTPIEIIIIGMLLLAAYISKNGINPVARLCEVFFPVFSLSILIFLVLAFQNFEARQLYSFWRIDLHDMYTTAKETFDAFLGFEVVLFVGAFALNKKNLIKASTVGTIFAILLHIVSVVIAIGVFAVEGLRYQMYPLLELAKSVVFPGAFAERFDLFFAFFWVLAIFTMIAIVYYLAAFNITRAMGLRNYRPMCILLMPVIYFISLTPQNISQAMLLSKTAFSLGGMIVLGIITILVFMTIIRKPLKKGHKE